METDGIESAVDLGTWLGRRQAFAAVAGRCSAADAECLRTIREKKLYRACGLNWEEFCRQRAGISRSLADQMVRQLEEFGPAYFHLAAITRITPENFRLIAPAVTEQGVQHGNELIVFSAENAVRLATAIEELRARAESQPKASEPVATDPGRRVRRIVKALEAAFVELENLSGLDMDLIQRRSLSASIEQGLKRLGRISCMIPR
jgi:hypothetical protein